MPAASAALLLSACALDGSTRPVTPPQTDFLRKALEATPVQREALWRQYRTESDTEAGRLRIAILESLPAHSGYDPATAQRHLKKLTGPSNTAETRSLAGLRLAEIGSLRDCRDQNAELQQRLDKIVDIERSLDSSSSRGSSREAHRDVR